MKARAYIKWLEMDASQKRCAIRRHSIDPTSNLPFLMVDGKMLCHAHAAVIVEAYNEITNPRVRSENEMIKAHRERDLANAKRRAVEEMRQKAARAPGFVYYIRIDQHIKIGYAADIAKRMRAYPPSAELLAAHPGTKETEKQIHLEYRRYLDRGREWFSPGKRLLEHIDRVRCEFGDPKILGYQYTKAKHAG